MIFCFGGHVWQSRTVYAVFVEGIMGSINVKFKFGPLFQEMSFRDFLRKLFSTLNTSRGLDASSVRL